MSFPEFEEAWQTGTIDARHSHEIESDYMEWESLSDEHAVLLRELREARESLPGQRAAPVAASG